METIKISPPNKLPNKNLSVALFRVWKEELEVYLAQDSGLAVFMTNGAYSTWEPAAVYSDRIRKPEGTDRNVRLEARRIELSAFLNIVGKSCDIIHYNDIIQNSTSLQWIYSKLGKYYKTCEEKEISHNIQEKGINFFDLFDLHYQYGMSYVDFYNKYRDLVITNLKKKGDIIIWRNNKVLDADEDLSPTFEDMILANVLFLIDTRLPGFVKDNYHYLVGKKMSLMDYRTDILDRVPTFLTKTEPGLPDNSTSSGAHQFKW